MIFKYCLHFVTDNDFLITFRYFQYIYNIKLCYILGFFIIQIYYNYQYIIIYISNNCACVRPFTHHVFMTLQKSTYIEENAIDFNVNYSRGCAIQRHIFCISSI